MEKLCMIFDYFKEAYHLIHNNKKLYRPQIAYIIIKIILWLCLGISFLVWIMNPRLSIMDQSRFFGPLLAIGVGALLVLLICSIIAIVIESGLYNMYRSCVLFGQTKDGDFGLGVRKFFFRFFLGKIVILLAWVIILPVYLITGIVSLTIGFAVVPMLIGVFLTMWKVSLVFNDQGIFKSIKDSFGFARRHFIPLSVLQLIHWAFTKGAVSSSSYNFSNSNFRNMGTAIPKDVTNILYDPEVMNLILMTLRVATSILVPVITIATLIGALIKMLFEVFFSVVLFIAFQRKFEKPEMLPEPDLTQAPPAQQDGEVLL